ncbi:MAG: HAD family phosphatase [Candidatus Liptonbacteria bacterium]
MTDIKGVAFDLEGTVVDVEAAHHRAHLAIAKEAGVTLTLDQALKQIPHFIGGPDNKIAEEIWGLGNKRLSAQELLALDKKYYNQFLETMEIAPRPGFLDVLEEIRSRGLAVAIGSLTPTVQAKVLLEHSGLATLFGEKHIVFAEHVANLKPAPDVFLKTTDFMGIRPENQLVFEDSPRGVQAAIAAGSAAVIGMPAYNRPDTIAALEKAGTKKIYLSWEDIDFGTLLAELAQSI